MKVDWDGVTYPSRKDLEEFNLLDGIGSLAGRQSGRMRQGEDGSFERHDDKVKWIE